VLKPLSSAIAIGSGGPFGAEGPIIVTGGACGSILAQVFHLTSAERKTLLVSGAAAGMSATFGTPLAALLLAVELLLFEWKPRSLVPVAIASAIAAWLRAPYFHLPAAPLIHVPLHVLHPTTSTMLSASLAGLVAGAFAVLISNVLYGVEDGFHRLRIHWAWWPAIGGLCVGIGGYFQPRALGVGFDVIDEVLVGHFVLSMLFGLLLVKATIWAIALGSGTSGGILAPLLMMGAVLGAAASGVLPGGDRTLWPLVCMAAVMGGAMRAPLTSVAFALELTHDIGALIPLLIASSIAYALALLVMRRSILTEKIARRGLHVTHEYGIDPLERLSVGDVMASTVVTVPATLPVQRLIWDYFLGARPHKHQGYPVVGTKGELVGVITRSDLLDDWTLAVLQGGPNTEVGASSIITFDLVNREAVTAFAWESSRIAAERMASHNVGRLPVLADDGTRQVVGMITRSDLLKSRARLAAEENFRERFLGIGASSRS
jgi:H+/Cl- antiporter ClcA/CBS domain-containing protein